MEVIIHYVDDNNKKANNQVYNIGCGYQTVLLDLFQKLKKISSSDIEQTHISDRPGDVKHSLADISKAKNLLGYDPQISVEEGLKKTFEWYQKQVKIKV